MYPFFVACGILKTFIYLHQEVVVVSEGSRRHRVADVIRNHLLVVSIKRILPPPQGSFYMPSPQSSSVSCSSYNKVLSHPSVVSGLASSIGSPFARFLAVTSWPLPFIGIIHIFIDFQHSCTRVIAAPPVIDFKYARPSYLVTIAKAHPSAVVLIGFILFIELQINLVCRGNPGCNCEWEDVEPDRPAV